MNPKYRYIYLFFGAIGFFMLFYYAIGHFSDMDPVTILEISVPDMVFFFLAYKTYPAETESKTQHGYHHRKVSNY